MIFKWVSAKNSCVGVLQYTQPIHRIWELEYLVVGKNTFASKTLVGTCDSREIMRKSRAGTSDLLPGFGTTDSCSCVLFRKISLQRKGPGGTGCCSGIDWFGLLVARAAHTAVSEM